MNITENQTTLVQRWKDGKTTHVNEYLGDESLVHLSLNGEKVTSLLASNEDLQYLLAGHFFTEYKMDISSRFKDIDITRKTHGIIVNVGYPDVILEKNRRGLVVSSCGACDQNNLSALVDSTPNVTATNELYSMEDLIVKLDEMRSLQKSFLKTGGVHAAGVLMEDNSFIVMEDIGRHNAVDKAIGSSIVNYPEYSIRALFLSGRCGWDIVSKAANTNIPVIVSVGAASSLAAHTARSANISLVSFVRDGKAVVIGPFNGRFHTKD